MGGGKTKHCCACFSKLTLGQQCHIGGVIWCRRHRAWYERRVLLDGCATVLDTEMRKINDMRIEHDDKF